MLSAEKYITKSLFRVKNLRCELTLDSFATGTARRGSSCTFGPIFVKFGCEAKDFESIKHPCHCLSNIS